MSESPNKTKSTRRDVIKLAGAAALGAAGAAALGATRVRAAASGFAVDSFRTRCACTTLAAPPNSVTVRMSHSVRSRHPGRPGFNSENYYGMIGNLTAVAWTGAGWLSVRPNGSTFSGVSNLNFAGSFPAWANLFILRFGPPPVPTTLLISDGKFIVRSGAAPTNFIVDFFGFPGPDQ